MKPLLYGLILSGVSLLLAAMLQGCAGADTRFRRDVQSVTLVGQGATGPDGSVSAGAQATFVLRDPDRSK